MIKLDYKNDQIQVFETHVFDATFWHELLKIFVNDIYARKKKNGRKTKRKEGRKKEDRRVERGKEENKLASEHVRACNLWKGWFSVERSWIEIRDSAYAHTFI